MTIDELIKQLIKASYDSDWGGDTVVVMGPPEYEYLDVNKIRLEQTVDGALVVLLNL